MEALQKEQEQQAEVVATNRQTTPATIYARDLDAFMEALEEYEAREAKNLASLAEKQRRAGNNRVKAAARKVRPGWQSSCLSSIKRYIWQAARPQTQAKGTKKKKDDSDSDMGASDDDFQPAKACFHFILLRESTTGSDFPKGCRPRRPQKRRPPPRPPAPARWLSPRPGSASCLLLLQDQITNALINLDIIALPGCCSTAATPIAKPAAKKRLPAKPKAASAASSQATAAMSSDSRPLASSTVQASQGELGLMDRLAGIGCVHIVCTCSNSIVVLMRACAQAAWTS